MVISCRCAAALFVLLCGGCVEEHPDWAGLDLSGSASESNSSSGTTSVTSASATTTATETGSATTAATATSATSGATASASDSSGSTSTTSSTSDVTGSSSSASSSSTGGGADHVIFATSAIYTGSFGGIAPADALCAEAGAAAMLPGTFRAIISTTASAVAERIVISNPVRNTQGELVANDAAALWGGNLINAVVYDETGAATNSSAWTGTTLGGQTAGSTCGDWMANNGTGGRGATASMDGGWLAAGSGGCNNSLRLYCISQ